MVALLSSKTVVKRDEPSFRKTPVLPTANTAMVAVTELGPLEATLVTSPEEWTRLYGRITAEAQDGPLAVTSFFKNGGRNLWTQRVLHYTDITSPAAVTGAKGTFALQTTGGLASAGFIDTVNLAPFNLNPGLVGGALTLVIDVDAGGDDTATILATGATSTSSSLTPGSVPAGVQLTYKVNGGPTQSATFAGTETTEQEIADAINATAIGISWSTSGGEVTGLTDRRGTGASLNILTADANLGLTVATTTGTGDVVDADAVTVAELKTRIELDVAGLTVTALGSGAMRISSDTTGASSSIQIDATSSIEGADFLNLDTALHSGSAATAEDTLTVDGKWIGEYSDSLSVVIAAPTSGNAGEFNMQVTRLGLVLETFANLKIGTADAADPNYVETIVNDATVGSNFVTVTDDLSGITPPGNVPANGTFALAGGDNGLTSLADLDFLGDTGSESGMRGFDTKANIRLLIVPGRATSAVHNGMHVYCEVTRNGSMFAIMDPPLGQTALEMRTYQLTTAALKNASEFGAIYWPRYTVLNPRTDIFGDVPNVVVPPSGGIAGVYARVDSSGSKPGEGVYIPPGGSERAQLLDAVAPETEEVNFETARDIVFPERINPINGDAGVYLDGLRNLKLNGNWQHVSSERGVIHISETLRVGLDFARHSNNNDALRQRMRRTADRFLTDQMRLGAFASTVKNLAYFVDVGDGVNTAQTIESGVVHIRIGLAMNTPAEFVIITISKNTIALEQDIATS